MKNITKSKTEKSIQYTPIQEYLRKNLSVQEYDSLPELIFTSKKGFTLFIRYKVQRKTAVIYTKRLIQSMIDFKKLEYNPSAIAHFIMITELFQCLSQREVSIICYSIYNDNSGSAGEHPEPHTAKVQGPSL